ncbi:hypothetical protein TSOC_006005 [Tetrabaena socialis]|uniref:EamA domain-containing protein n=1 Tax=Tetrabaena socialis TaxID=47790 RepID=A0A2J8A4U8_9CHLO|nr:hypothetical protein TSOC_006005 [Tetrabaena socialis]|eukprot:PNH07541.1 hypothetical protein TSOC_006005 [Tetrabaena socialis]
MAPLPRRHGLSASRPASARGILRNRLAALPNGRGGASAPVGVLDRAPVTTAPGQGAAADGRPAVSTPMPVGFLALSIVPVLWGTYNPCIRYLYAEPDALDPASLTAVRTALSAGALLLPALLGYLFKECRGAFQRHQQQRAQAGTFLDGAAADAETSDQALPAAAAGPGAKGASVALFSAPINSTRLGPVLTCTFNSVILGGLELGLLNFLGTALQVEGLHSTSATRAGFLAEVTAVLTPLVSYLAGYQVPQAMWLAVAVGLVGSTMVAYDTAQAHEDDAAGAGAATVQGTPAPAALAAVTAVPAEGGAATASSAFTDSALQAGSSSAADAFAPLGAAGASSVASYASTAASAVVDAAQLAGDPAESATAALDAASAVALEVASLAAGAAASTAVPSISDSIASVALSTAEAAATATPLAVTGGELYLLLACLFFSIGTIRMGMYAPRMDTVSLAAMKKVGLSSMSLLWMASHNLGNGAALGSIFAFPDLSTRTPLSVAVLVYSGLGPGALATYLQFVGLSTVPATSAQVIFSLTPLCTAYFAYLVLGGESTGPLAWAGGSLIIFAALMAAWAQRQHFQQKK